jgi:hypothetical protein
MFIVRGASGKEERHHHSISLIELIGKSEKYFIFLEYIVVQYFVEGK